MVIYSFHMYCCLFLIVVVSLATGVPSVYYGMKSKNAVLRAAHKTDICRNIHNDASAITLKVFGWFFSIPWLIALCVCLCELSNHGVVVGVTIDA